MRLLVRAVLVVALAATAWGTSSPVPATAAVTGPTASGVTAVATSTTSVRVQWQAGADAHRWLVAIYGEGFVPLGVRTVPGTDREVDIGDLAPGTSFGFYVTSKDPDGSSVPWTGPATAATPAESACAGRSRTCVAVDARTATGPANGTGGGLLNGVDATTSASRISALEPDHWRMLPNDLWAYYRARENGAAVTMILGQVWVNATGGAGNATAPWTVPELYQWWVRSSVQGLVDAQRLPDFWEVDNEPNAYRYSTPMTAADLAEYHRLTAEAIRDVIPDAKVVGPGASIAVLGSGVPDLDAFVTRMADAGVQFDAVSWHENGGGCYQLCAGGPRGLLQHVADVRGVLAREGWDDTEVHITEWGAPWWNRNPGANVGYLSSLVTAGVDRGSRTCWTHRNPNGSEYKGCDRALDGLLLSDGTTPTDVWHVAKAFADMTGPSASAVRSTVDDPAASVLATLDGSTVNVLYGHHQHCQPAVDHPCTGNAAPPPKVATDVVVTVPDGAGRRWRVEASVVPNVEHALHAPTTVGSWTLRSSRQGELVIPAVQVADGEALLLTITPR